MRLTQSEAFLGKEASGAGSNTLDPHAATEYVAVVVVVWYIVVSHFHQLATTLLLGAPHLSFAFNPFI